MEVLGTLGVRPSADNPQESRVHTTPSFYAYLKISEGCNRACSFCAIPYIQGKHRSRTIESLTREAEHLGGGRC